MWFYAKIWAKTFPLGLVMVPVVGTGFFQNGAYIFAFGVDVARKPSDGASIFGIDKRKNVRFALSTLIDAAVSGESANEIVVTAAVYEIYKNFSEITLGSPVIYISHRLSSCIFCDMVAVLENGEVAQIGTHAELLKQSVGAYLTLWNARAKHYNEQLNEQLRAAEAQAIL